MFRFEELIIYKDAQSLTTDIYRITSNWPKSEMFGLTDQLRRAVVSISLNIAEGTSRKVNDFGHFLDISRGSCYECVAILKIALDQKYINQLSYDDIYSKCERLSKMISAFKASIN